MKLGNWEIEIGNYWGNLHTFYLFFVGIMDSSEFHICICNFYFSFHNYIKEEEAFLKLTDQYKNGEEITKVFTEMIEELRRG